MGLFESKTRECFCAFCRSTRQVYQRKSMGIFNFVSCFFGATVVTLILFQDFDPRGLIFLVLFLLGTELFIQLRWRLKLVCPQCGFDPVLYVKDLPAAVAKVQRRLEERKASPMSILAAPLQIPTRRAKSDKDLKLEAKERGLQNSPRILSRHA